MWCIKDELEQRCGAEFFITQTKLTSWSSALLEKPPVVQLFKIFSTFGGTRKVITVFTTALHWPLS
jgi:hypothetical protein